MIDSIKNFFSRHNVDKKREDEIINETMSEILNYPIEGVYHIDLPQGYTPDKKTIIVLDDNPGIPAILMEDIVGALKDIPCRDDFSVVTITTEQAVFAMREALEHGDIGNIVAAILDLSIGGTRFENGTIVMLDGIDAYKIIKDKYPDAIIRFYTAHSLNEKNPAMQTYFSKFKDVSGERLDVFSYIKNPFSTSRKDMFAEIKQHLLGLCNDS